MKMMLLFVVVDDDDDDDSVAYFFLVRAIDTKVSRLEAAHAASTIVQNAETMLNKKVSCTAQLPENISLRRRW